MDHHVEDIRARLESIAEELADLAIERLQAVVGGDADHQVIDERRITRARRAVVKAAGLLTEEPSSDW